MDVGSDASVAAAARKLAGATLYAIVNNAGVARGTVSCPARTAALSLSSGDGAGARPHQATDGVVATFILGDLYFTLPAASTHTRRQTEVIFNTNLNGPKRVCDAFVPMLDASRGRIVNVSSGAASGYMKRVVKVGRSVVWLHE